MPEAPQRTAIVGCGYVGTAVGEALVRAGGEVHGTTTSPSRTAELEAKGIVPHVLEVADAAALHGLLAECEAVLLSVGAGREGADYRSVYLAAASHLVAALERTTVSRVVYTSSTRVYAQDDGRWVDEDSPTQPADENGRTLLEAERVLLDAGRVGAGVPPVFVTVLRLGGIYGPGRDPAARIRQFAGQERRDGDACVNMIHLDDIVAAIVRLLPMPHGGVLNLCDDGPAPRREYYDRIIAAAGLPPIRWISPAGSPPLGKRVGNALIKQTLGLQLQHPFH